MKSYCITDEEGSTRWVTINGYGDEMLHREDGPAVEHYDGTKMWFQYGGHHREDGPAYIGSDGHEEYWYQGKQIKVNTLKEFQSYIRNKAFW
jgi:hypothetical protein